MSPRAWAAFAAVSVLWGIPYLFIEIAVDDGVSPTFLAWFRVVLAAALLMALAWRLGLLGSLRGRWRWLAVFAVIEITLPFPLIAAGQQHVSSSLAAILIAAVPLFVALLALRFDESERIVGWRLVGLFVGLAGVVALVGIDVAGDSDELLGALAILFSAFCYAVGPMILNAKLSDLDPRASMGAALVVAAIVLTPATAIGPSPEIPTTGALVALLALGVLCTAAAFAIYALLVTEVGPGRAVIITYVAPVVAVTAGITALDETLGPGAILGLVLILTGSWLATGGMERVGEEPRPG